MNNIKGYGFRPSDEELIGYLEAITHDRDSHVQYITPLEDICEFEPRELPGLSAMEPGCRQWYFFYLLNYKYQTGKLIKRATKEGHWKPTGRCRKIKASATNMVIGSKRSLTFQKGHPVGKTKKKKNSISKFDNDKNKQENLRNKTKHESNKRKKAVWVLHEYKLNTAIPSDQKTVFLGKLMKQSEEANISNNSGESSQSSPSYLRNQVAKNTATPEDHLNPSKPFLEMEVPKDSGGVPNQFSTNKQDNDIRKDESCPQEGSNQHNFLDRNEVSNLPLNLGNYALVDPISRDWGDSNWWSITDQFEAPKDSALVRNQFSCDHGNPTENSIVVNNSKTYSEERSDQNNIVAENEDSNLVANFKNDGTEDFDPLDLFAFDGGLSNVDEVLNMIQTPENYNVLQNQSSTNEVDIKTKYSNSIDNGLPTLENQIMQ